MNFNCPEEAIASLTTLGSPNAYTAWDMQDGFFGVDVYFTNNTWNGCSGTATILIDASDTDGNCAMNGPYVIMATFNDVTPPSFTVPANTGNHVINDCPYVPGFDYAAAFVYDNVNGTLTFNGPSGPVDLTSHVPTAYDQCLQNGTTQLGYDQLDFLVESVTLSSSNPPCVRDIRTRFRATDKCNNATTGISQRSPAPGRDLRIVFSIQDTEAPTFSALPNPSLLTSNGALCGVGVQGITTGPVAPNTPFTVAGLPFATPNNTQFDDNCSSDANIILDLLTIVETNPGDDCSNQITLTWRVTDECGKLSTAAQVYTLQTMQLQPLLRLRLLILLIVEIAIFQEVEMLLYQLQWTIVETYFECDFRKCKSCCSRFVLWRCNSNSLCTKSIKWKFEWRKHLPKSMDCS
ncbi:MAG: hypothetical protein R2769_02320 [Saprospiraceae bacterium]